MEVLKQPKASSEHHIVEIASLKAKPEVRERFFVVTHCEKMLSGALLLVDCFVKLLQQLRDALQEHNSQSHLCV